MTGVGLSSLATRPTFALRPPSPSDIEAIGQVGMEHAPLEACGILVIGVGIQTLQNFADDPANNSLMRTDDILDGIITLTGHQPQGMASDLRARLVFWHTHPGGQEGPSTIDKQVREDQPDMRLLVVSIPSGLAVEY